MRAPCLPTVTLRVDAPRTIGPYILLHLKLFSSSTTYHPGSHPPRSSISMMSTPPHTANISTTYVEPPSPSCLVPATICHQDHHTKVYTPSICHTSEIISIHDHRLPCHNLYMLLPIVEGWPLHLKLYTCVIMWTAAMILQHNANTSLYISRSHVWTSRVISPTITLKPWEWTFSCHHQSFLRTSCHIINSIKNPSPYKAMLRSMK